MAITDAPELHGEPTQRSRIHGVGINLRTTRWCGPTEDNDLFQEYYARCHRHAVLSGSAYLRAKPADIWAEMAVLAQKQNFSVDPATTFVNASFDDWAPMVLPPSQMIHVRQHMAFDEKLNSLQHGGFVYDASQNVGWG